MKTIYPNLQLVGDAKSVRLVSVSLINLPSSLQENIHLGAHLNIEVSITVDESTFCTYTVDLICKLVGVETETKEKIFEFECVYQGLWESESSFKDLDSDEFRKSLGNRGILEMFPLVRERIRVLLSASNYKIGPLPVYPDKIVLREQADSQIKKASTTKSRARNNPVKSRKSSVSKKKSEK